MKKSLYVLVFMLSILCFTACKKEKVVEPEIQNDTGIFAQDEQENKGESEVTETQPIPQQPEQSETTPTPQPTTTARYVTITFVQKGQKNIVKKVEKGGTLAKIPTPKQRKGYDVAWDRTDFTDIQKNLTVTAILTPKQYVITYDLGERKNDHNASLQSNTQKVTYHEACTLYVPSCKGYDFIGWSLSGNDTGTYFTDGIYKKAKNITLTAIWVKVKDHEWTNNY